LGTTIKYLRRTTSGDAINGMSTTAKYLRSAAGIGQGTTINYLGRATSAAAGNCLGNTIKYLRGASGIGLGTMIKYLRRTTRQKPVHHDPAPATKNERLRRGRRPGNHNEVLATHNERRRGQRPEPMLGIIDLPIQHKRPAFVFFCLPPSNKQNRTTDVVGLGDQCLCGICPWFS
jgi:hypothetical protein